VTDTTTALLIGVLATFLASLTTFMTLVYNGRQQRLREERARRWEIEDRALLAKQVMDTSSALAQTAAQQHDVVVAAIADNTTKTELSTEKATEAFREANHVNHKIADLNSAIIDNSSKIEEAIAGAHAAYEEANHVNNKISQLQERLLVQEKHIDSKNPESRKS